MYKSFEPTSPLIDRILFDPQVEAGDLYVRWISPIPSTEHYYRYSDVPAEYWKQIVRGDSLVPTMREINGLFNSAIILPFDLPAFAPYGLTGVLSVDAYRACFNSETAGFGSHA